MTENETIAAGKPPARAQKTVNRAIDPEVAVLERVPGVPQTYLSAERLATFPWPPPPAPWTVRGSAVFWVQRANRDAGAALDPRLDRLGPPIAVVGLMVRYRDTPVGAYDEVAASIVYATRRGVRVTTPFIAVDSPASVIGGRALWALPKTLADFDGAPAAGSTMTASGDGWSVRATPRVLAPVLPLGGKSRTRAIGPDGIVRDARGSLRGRFRPAMVSVEVDADPVLSGWFRSGRHVGCVAGDVEGSIA